METLDPYKLSVCYYQRSFPASDGIFIGKEM